MKQFEFHHTVTGISVKMFAHLCLQRRMRALVIDNLTNDTGKTVSQDFITASEFKDEMSYSGALEMLAYQKSFLVSAGAVVLRSKIEVNAKQELAGMPIPLGDIMLPAGMYHETHVTVSVPDEKLPQFFSVARQHRFHVSMDGLQNAHRHRRLRPGHKQQDAKFWLTARSPDASLVRLESHTNAMMCDLDSFSISHKEPQYELVIHDSNLPHDDRWMGRPRQLSDDLYALAA
jgi:hypothetical protein